MVSVIPWRGYAPFPTFNWVVYVMDGLASDTPSARLIASFPRKAGTSCATPLLADRYFLITVPAWKAVVFSRRLAAAHYRPVDR
jgi:hypothetical protein